MHVPGLQGFVGVFVCGTRAWFMIMWPPVPSALLAAASRPLRPQSVHFAQILSASDLLHFRHWADGIRLFLR